MIKKIKNLLLSMVLVFNFGTVLAPALIHAAPADDACQGLTAAGVTCDKSTSAANNSFSKIIKTIVNVLSIVVGAVAVIMVIIGGFRYVISGGDSNGVQGAKNTIIYAIVGLVVVLFAQVIVRFVYSNVIK